MENKLLDQKFNIMDSISIASVNVQGLGNQQKRRDVFHYLRSKNYSIYFLQDTHFERKIEKQIRAEWGYECFFASFNSQSRGVAILLNNNFDFRVKNLIKDQQGNYIILTLKTMEKDILLANIYGPNNDNPLFYQTLQENVNKLENPNIIIGGDWNLVLDPSIDYCNYKHNNNVKAQEKVIEIMGNLNLMDVWREINPEIRRYSWRRPNPPQQARLDFFLIAENLLLKIREADIIPGYRSDHSIIVIKLNFKKENKPRNFWKLNNSLLKDKKYVEEINEVIKKIKEQYAALVYDREKIDSIPLDELQFTISDQLFLDTLIMEIRKKTIEYGIKKKREDTIKESLIEAEIKQLEHKNDRSEDENQKLQENKELLINLRKEKINGVLIRSRARWAAEGEKVTKYFCNLEKRHYVSKQMFKLITKKGEILDETKNMLQETKDFYQNLYREREVEDIDLNTYVKSLQKLSKEDAENLEGLITLEEATDALRKMKNGKSPGTDGISADFYKFFWRQLGNFIVRSLNEGFSKKELSVTQREGIITCLPKGDKPREYLQNWRPISLLNVAYKIGSSCIAQRIKSVLPDIINNDQTGFVPGRYIGDNIRLLYDMIDYLKEKDLPGLLIAIDFEKAFDSVNWNYMRKVLELFGFGESICQWIYTFYNNIRSSVIVNGQASVCFPIKRGCRQGDPVSPYLFILCAEVLACRIRENKNIKGIQVSNKECKVSQFADDTSLFLEGDKRSFEETFAELECFEKISGLKLNHEKTCNIWLGSKRKSKVKFLSHLNMKWNPAQFKILGLWFTNDLSQMVELNLNDKFNETKKLFNIWSKRSCTPLGRVAVLKSLILTKLVYLWILLPNPPNKIIQQLQQMCFKFVWDKKRDKIKRTIAIQNIEEGGISVPCIKAFINSLKLSWFKKVLQPTCTSKWKLLLFMRCPKLAEIEYFGGEFLSECNINPFWNSVFKAYSDLYQAVDVDKPEELLMEPIFLNTKFKIDNKVFHFIDWTRKEVFFVKDLINNDGEFLSYEEFQRKHKIKTTFLKFYGCISTVKKYLRMKKIHIETNYPFTTNKNQALLQHTIKGVKMFYNIFINKENIHEPKVCKKWENLLNSDISWSKIFSKTKNIQDIKYRWFQIKITNRILVTNSILKEMNVIDTNMCNFCHTERDTILHYLWQCEFTKKFWNELEKLMREKIESCNRIALTPTLILFGYKNNCKTDKGLDHILLAAKFFVYKCRINKNRPLLPIFLRELNFIYSTDIYVHRILMKENSFQKKWEPYKSILHLEM